MWYFFSVADGASLYRPEENFLFPYDNLLRKYPSLLTMSTTLTTSFFSIWNAIRPSISHPEVIRPAISQQVPSITDIFHPFIIPRRLLRRASRYKEVFLLQCVLRSVDRKKLNQTASYHLNQLKQDNAFSKVQTGLCTEHNSIFKICLCLVEKKKKTIAEPKW